MVQGFKQVGQTQAELHILKFDKMDAIIRLLHQQPSLIINVISHTLMTVV